MRGRRLLLIVAVFFLIAGGAQTSALAMSRDREGGDIHGSFHSSFQREAPATQVAYARGFHEGRRGFVGGPWFGFGGGLGWDGPWYWGPDYYPPQELINVNYGTIQFKVTPDNTQVYLDQNPMGTVNELNHHRVYTAGGQHDVRLVAPDGQTYDRSVFVAVGQKIKIDAKL
jgi:hypothetical protein